MIFVYIYIAKYRTRSNFMIVITAALLAHWSCDLPFMQQATVSTIMCWTRSFCATAIEKAHWNLMILSCVLLKWKQWLVQQFLLQFNYGMWLIGNFTPICTNLQGPSRSEILITPSELLSHSTNGLTRLSIVRFSYILFWKLFYFFGKTSTYLEL